MNRILSASIALTLAGTSSLFAADEEGFVPLFNGRDLTGWTPVNVAADTFSVKDGMIIDTGVPTGLMRTTRMYENFILEVDWRHLKSGGNSGVFTWSDGLPGAGGPFPRGIEVQILDPGYGKLHKGENEWFTTHGDLFPVRGALMTPTGRISKPGQRSFPIEDRTKPSPEWNHYRLVANRGELRLSVNGKEVTVGKDCVPRKGFLCLEAEGSEVHFKNFRIKELPSANPTPDQVANAYEGFRPLFNGKDLSGWKTGEAVLKAWSLRGASFVAKGVGSESVALATERRYRDVELCLDWRLSAKPGKQSVPVLGSDGGYSRGANGELLTEEIESAGATAVVVRGVTVNLWDRAIGSGTIAALPTPAAAPAIPTAIHAKSKADAPVGKWNRCFIKVAGQRISVRLNDQEVITDQEIPGLPESGEITLINRGSDAEFGNLYLKEL